MRKNKREQTNTSLVNLAERVSAMQGPRTSSWGFRKKRMAVTGTERVRQERRGESVAERSAVGEMAEEGEGSLRASP